ncbi:unnamed protein product [Linum tenue]|uniref:Uncharacterized protein n=1 Tax=Linum tenue TaxID=586396 RepID=A0AAV0IWT0_9ROSI|nr:unnamed protein product [Linum tenue]
MIQWTAKLSASTDIAQVGRMIWQSWLSHLWRERCSRMYAGVKHEAGVLLKKLDA